MRSAKSKKEIRNWKRRKKRPQVMLTEFVHKIERDHFHGDEAIVEDGYDHDNIVEEEDGNSEEEALEDCCVTEEVIRNLIHSTLQAFDEMPKTVNSAPSSPRLVSVFPYIFNLRNWKKKKKNVGIIARSVRNFFEIYEARNAKCGMKVTFLKLYNKDTANILAPDNSNFLADKSKSPIALIEDGKGGVLLGGLEEEVVSFPSAVDKILCKGSSKRRPATTILNKQSSQSRSIFSIIIHINGCPFASEEIIKRAELNLIVFAHRGCIRMWYVENESISCEVCLQKWFNVEFLNMVHMKMIGAAYPLFGVVATTIGATCTGNVTGFENISRSDTSADLTQEDEVVKAEDIMTMTKRQVMMW